MMVHRYGYLRPAMAAAVVLIVVGCAATSPAVPSSSGWTSGPPASLLLVEDTTLEPTPTPDASAIAAAAENRLKLESWVDELNAVDIEVAATLAEVLGAYSSGPADERMDALYRWLSATESAADVDYDLGASCPGTIADLYASAFSDMAGVAQDLVDSLASSGDPSGVLPPPPPVSAQYVSPKTRLRGLASTYHGGLAGRLNADDIERFCTPLDPDTDDLPRPTKATSTGGVRFGSPTVLGWTAYALAENTTDDAVFVGDSTVTFRNAAGDLLKGRFGALNTVVPPRSTVIVPFFGGGIGFGGGVGIGPAPAGWKTAAVVASVQPDTTAAVFTFTRPTSMSSSLGLLVGTRVTNTDTEQPWCTAVTAAVVHGDRVVAGGWEDMKCPSPGEGWAEVVRLDGASAPDGDLHVSLGPVLPVP